MAAKHDTHNHSHHITPWWYYALNLGALAILMLATILFSYVDFGHTWINNVIALAIAITKMMLVIMIFMGVKWGTRLIKLWAATGFVWFLLMAIVFGDYTTREWEAVPSWDPDHRPYPVLGSRNTQGEHPIEGGHEGGGH
jgi:cytochrome c oxidase subunit IV